MHGAECDEFIPLFETIAKDADKSLFSSLVFCSDVVLPAFQFFACELLQTINESQISSISMFLVRSYI